LAIDINNFKIMKKMQRINVPPNYKDIKKKVSIIIYLLYSSVSGARGRSKTWTGLKLLKVWVGCP
jgi:hypothetical protein